MVEPKKTSSALSNSSRYKFSKKNGLEVVQELQQNPTLKKPNHYRSDIFKK
jgi:hypothetical protein